MADNEQHRVKEWTVDVGGRSTSLDVLRVVAFLMVVFAHLSFWSVPKFLPDAVSLKNIAWGGYGVRIFFFLSGAAMTFGTFRRLETDGVIPFYLRRLRAILPGYWFATLVLGAGWLVVSHAWYWKGDSWSLLAAVFGMNEYLGMRSIIGGAWFVGSMLLLYLFVPVIYRCFKRGPVVTLLVSAAISAASLRYSDCLGVLAPVWNPVPHYNALAHLFEFAAGVFVFEYVRKVRVRYVVAVIVSAVLLAVYFAFPHKMLFDYRNIVGVFASVLTVVIAVFMLDAVHWSRVSSAIASWFGRNTYLAFLYHFPIIHQLVAKGESPVASLFWCKFIMVVALSYGMAYLSSVLMAMIGKHLLLILARFSRKS